MKTLVLYYSRSGNTKAVAETIAATLKADIEDIVCGTDYSGALGFMKGGRDAMTGESAPIQPLTHNPSNYDLVVLCQPVWAFAPVPPVNTLTATGVFNGRKVALAATYVGSGAERCLDKTAARMPGAVVVARASFLRIGQNREENLRKAAAWAEELQSTGNP